MNSIKRIIALQILLLVCILSSLVSCKNYSEKGKNPVKPGRDQIADLNRYFVQKDKERIMNYIERKGLTMTESPTGLWYGIIKHGDGKTFSDNDKISLDYECSLLDGTKCYSSKETGPKVVIIGKTVMEQGLNEGLRMLGPGAEAIFILPPFLAYGFRGDGNKIPSRAIIVYNINILQPK
jgi:FKBP-type peptidyl-prolyl cis-trans isomerase FkpA